MRDGFREIVSGWTLISGMADITERIERAAKWTEANGPLEQDEEATIKLMIESQIARGVAQGDFEPYLSDDDGEEMDPLEEKLSECQLMRDGQCLLAGSQWCDFECPMRDSEHFAGSAAWNKAHGKASP